VWYSKGMKIRGIQFSPVLGNVDQNLAFHRTRITEAVDAGIDLVIFPELSISGYYLKDLVYDIALRPDSPVIRQFEEWSQKIDIVIGAPFEEKPGIIYNCAFYFSKGQRLHTHRKVQLPNYGMFEEQMIFRPGNEFRSFQVGDFTVGLIICREILFPAYAYLYYLQDVDFLIGISNSPARAMGKEGFASFRLWERMGEVFSVHFNQNYVFVNRTGFEDGMGFGGGSYLALPGLGIVQKARYLEDDTLDGQISLEDVRRARVASNYYRDERPEVVLKELMRILHA